MSSVIIELGDRLRSADCFSRRSARIRGILTLIVLVVWPVGFRDIVISLKFLVPFFAISVEAESRALCKLSSLIAHVSHSFGVEENGVAYGCITL